MTVRYAFRRANKTDYGFLWMLHLATMREYIAQTWGWDQEAQEEIFKDRFNRHPREIVEVNGQPVGAVSIEQSSDELHILNIEVLPTVQGPGIGSSVIGDLVAAAHAEGRSARLAVLKVNPARRLYERLGFELIAETTTHFEMRADPPKED